MTTHPSRTAGQSQCAKILARLSNTPGEWVEMPELVKASGSYNVHSCISDLRARGHDIEQMSETVKRQTHSFYRLVSDGIANPRRPLDLMGCKDG